MKTNIRIKVSLLINVFIFSAFLAGCVESSKTIQTREGTIIESKKPETLVTMVQIDINPRDVYAGQTFTFNAITDIPAQGATLRIADEDYPMTGSGTNWTIKQNIQKTGELAYSISAINKDNVKGIPKRGFLNVRSIKPRYSMNNDGTLTDLSTGDVLERFEDNDDGTVTDLYTNIMWLNQPKIFPVITFDEAIDYCKNLSYNNLTGWRLPTAWEFQSIIDEKQQAPALISGHLFKIENIFISFFYWTQTQLEYNKTLINVVDLYRGKIGVQKNTGLYKVWPVRDNK